MVGVLIAGHGNFPTGAFSGVALVAGSTDNVYACDFVDGMSSAELKDNMKAAIEKMGTNEVLILADLAGGTPFRTGVELKAELPEKSIRVIAGANMPGIMEAAFACSDDDATLEELAAQFVEAAKDGIVDWDASDDEDEDEAPEFEDGL